MKQLVRLVFLSVFGAVLATTTASAAQITCSGTFDNKFFEASLDPAVSCAGPLNANNVFPNDLSAFGFTWLAQDKDPGGDTPKNGANEAVLTILGANTTGGSFTINPINSQCGLVDCNFFAFGLKFADSVIYWDLGKITTTTTFAWETTQFAFSNGAAYARFAPTAPEPGVMFLLATGAAIGIRRRFIASR